MTDRELLELAAKAAGIELHRIDEDEYYPKSWNPLTNDDDAFRLMVQLGIGVAMFDKEFPTAKRAFISDIGSFPTMHDDPYRATRYSIVKAAAALGEGWGTEEWRNEWEEEE
jgi:hypothetical protein